MIQMTTDGKIKALQREGIEQALNRIEHELRNLALQAFDIGYKEGYKTGKECKEEPEEKDKDCRFCKFLWVRADEEPCASCRDQNFFKIRESEPKTTQDTVNLKMRDTNGDWHEMEVPVEDPLTFKDIEIGDELESIVDNPIYVPTVIIVTHNCSYRIYGFRKNTGAYIQLGASDLPKWHKTGKTYPEIAKLIGGRE